MSLLIPSDYRKMPGKWQAPEWFIKRLHDIDPALEIFFNVNRQRWIIIRNAGAEQTHVKTLESVDGGYRAPDEDTLNWLKQSDMWAQAKTPQQLAADQDYEESRQREKITQSIKSDFHDAAMDDKIQIKRALGNATIFNPTQPSDSEESDASGGKDKP